MCNYSYNPPPSFGSFQQVLIVKWSLKAGQGDLRDAGRMLQKCYRSLSEAEWGEKSRKEQYFTWQITLMLLVGFKEKEQIVWTDRSKQSTSHTFQKHTLTSHILVSTYKHNISFSLSLSLLHTNKHLNRVIKELGISKHQFENAV